VKVNDRGKSYQTSCKLILFALKRSKHNAIFIDNQVTFDLALTGAKVNLYQKVICILFRMSLQKIINWDCFP